MSYYHLAIFFVFLDFSKKFNLIHLIIFLCQLLMNFSKFILILKTYTLILLYYVLSSIAMTFTIILNFFNSVFS